MFVASFARLMRPVAMLTVAAALAACSGEAATEADANGVKVTPYLGSVVIGDANSKVKVVEYASLTCSHCRDFWKQVFPRIKSTYIDTGKISYELHDFPTAPVEVAMAAAAISRCKGREAYYDIVDDFVTSHHDLLNAAQSQTGAGPVLVAIGGRHGLSPDEVRACVNNKDAKAFIEKSVRDAQGKVSATPTVFVNDVVVPEHSFAAISAAIEAQLNPGAAPAAPAPAPAQ